MERKLFLGQFLIWCRMGIRYCSTYLD
ncbi:BnaA04g14870D [Brassica napus]|uniref:BnaA04g14870D protein n=1 Tax=Brassica napus TaxID=3708 RepID=A0A078CPH6_BRANA|nr:BnaA04g14870D [Brassica napus]